MISRRKLFRTAAIAITGAPFVANAAGAKKNRPLKPDRMPPQLGDILAYPSWEHEGRVLVASEIQLGEKPITVFPQDPISGITRERSRLNQMLVMRLAPTSAESDIIVYSGVCTHTACAVSEWDEASGHIICPCHSSAFDPLQNAKVINGPARRPLPSLPIKIEDDKILVAGEFTARVGAKKKKTSF